MMAVLGLLIAWKLFGYVWDPRFGLVLRLVHPSVPLRLGSLSHEHLGS